MSCLKLRRLPLLAVLCAALAPTVAAPAPASAEELTAYSLEHQAEYRRILGASEEFGMTFTALATGRLSRVSVPVEFVYWTPQQDLKPMRVEFRAIDANGGPSKQRSAVVAEIQPADILRQPVGTPTYSYLGNRSDALFTGEFRLAKGTRYALVLSTSGAEYIIGHDNDSSDNGVGWNRSLCGCGFNDDWRRDSLPMAVKVYVEADAPPPPPADTIAPTASIDSPADGAAFELGSDAFAAFGCDDAGGSGLKTCDATLDGAPIAAGDPVPTDTVGSHTLSVAASDSAGNTVRAESRFRVVWPFAGFFSPVNAMPTLNVVQAGSAVPMKFSLGGDRGLGVLDGPPTVRGASCDAGAESDVIEETAAETLAGLSYDPATARYQYVWKTAKEWAGTCRRFDLKLVDGSARSAVFRMR